jgi:peptidoglycan hydrolase-like protein with peptidoglycan-binding domain
LTFLNLYEGPIDGSFTSTLGTAIRAFQEHVGTAISGTLDEPGLQYLRQYSDHHGYGRRRHGSAHKDRGDQGAHQKHAGHAAHPEVSGDQLWEYVDAVNNNSLHNFGAETAVKGDRHAFDHGVVQTVINVQHHALEMMSLSDQAFARACERYHDFINAEISLAEGGEDAVAGHVAMQVARAICDAIGIRVCSVVIEGMRGVLVQISMGLSHSMSKISYSQFVGETSASIKHFYQTGMMDLALQVGTWRHNFELELNQLIDPLLADLNSGKPIPAEHEPWIQHAYNSGGSNLDQVVQAVFGIRPPSELEEMEAEIYAHLVHKFYEARAGM